MPDISLRPSRPGDEAQLQKIWKLSFHDEDSFIHIFFQRFYQPGMATLMEEDGLPVSAIFTLEGSSFKLPGQEALDCPYVYSLGTLPEHRGKSYGGQVIAESARRAYEAGCDHVCFLPASESLYHWYNRVLGTQTRFFAREAQLQRLPGAKGTLEKLSPRDYGMYREALLKNRPHTVFSQNLLQWQAQLCDYFGGGLYALHTPFGDGCAAVEFAEEQLFIKELLLDGAGAQAASQLLLEAHAADNALLRLPVWAELGSLREFCVAIPRPDGRDLPITDDAYWGFAFD